MKKELNKKIIAICEEAGTAAAAEKCGELMDELDREYDDRIARGMTEIEAYRDVLKRLDEIKSLVDSLPAEESEEEKADRKKGHKTLKRIIDKVESIMWVAAIPGYLIYSLATHRWKTSWIIFLVVALLQIILDTVVDYNDVTKDPEKVMYDGKSALLWVGSALLYVLLGFLTHRWLSCAVVFVLAVIVQLFMDRDKGKKDSDGKSGAKNDEQ